MFNKILFVICMFCVCILLVGEGRGRSQELISAKVLSIEGQVELRRQPNDQPQIQKISFKIEDRLKAGDTIVTGRNGRLVLALSDGSQAIIAPKTMVVIEDLSHSPRTLFNILRGKTRIHIEKLGGQPNPYRVNTPTAVIAVRGTIFDVLVDEAETQVFLHEGEVAITNLKSPNQPVILSAGQMTRVLFERLPNPPSPFKSRRTDKTFRPGKAGRIERASQASRRIADASPIPDYSRGARRSNEGPRPGFGRSGVPSPSDAKPDLRPGGSAPAGAKPSANPGNTGKRQ